MEPFYKRNIEDTTKTDIDTMTSGHDVYAEVTRLHEKINFLKQQTENQHRVFTEKVNSSLELRKWVLVAIVSILGLFIAGSVFVANLIMDSLKSSRDVQSEYYNQLLENNLLIQNLLLKSEITEKCLISRRYWEYEECFN